MMLTKRVRMVPLDCAGIAVETRPLAAARKTERGAVCHKPDRITACDWMASDRLVCQILSWQRKRQRQNLSFADDAR